MPSNNKVGLIYNFGYNSGRNRTSFPVADCEPLSQCRSAASRRRARRRASAFVRDHNGLQLAYVYFEDKPGRRSAAKLLTRDDARRIPANIAKLPELEGKD